MATNLKNLSSHQLTKPANLEKKRFAILVSEWNEQVTDSMFIAARETLIKHGVPAEAVTRIDVPGSYELVLAAQKAAAKKEYDAVICIGCVIQGETRHFEFICHAVAQGLIDVSLKYDKPVSFGVLTPDTMQQALDRAGGKHGNKGDEAAMAAIKMLLI